MPAVFRLLHPVPVATLLRVADSALLADLLAVLERVVRGLLFAPGLPGLRRDVALVVLDGDALYVRSAIHVPPVVSRTVKRGPGLAPRRPRAERFKKRASERDGMRLVCVGTGTAVPDPEHVGAGFWVEAGAARLLLDCGPGVVHGMVRRALPWPALTHLVLSHFHNDHTGDVPFLMFALRWGTLPARTAPLTVVGPVGTKALFARLGAGFGSHVHEPDFELQFVELEADGELGLPGGGRLRACVTPHTAASLGFRIDVAASAIGYTSDTGESEDVARFMKGVELLLAECSLPDALAMDSHLTPARLARMARDAAPAQLLVTHVYPKLARSDIPALLDQAGWGGGVVVVEDGDEFFIGRRTAGGGEGGGGGGGTAGDGG